MKITVKKVTEEVVELDVPAYFTDGNSFCPSFYKVTESSIICITKYGGGVFNMLSLSNYENVISLKGITAEEFYQVVKELTFYVQTI
jgi:hypothetical protein